MTIIHNESFEKGKQEERERILKILAEINLVKDVELARSALDTQEKQCGWTHLGIRLQLNKILSQVIGLENKINSEVAK